MRINFCIFSHCELCEVLTINWADFVVGVEHVDNLLKHGFNGQSVLNHGANILKMKVD